MLSLGHEVRLGCRDGRDGSVEHPLGPKTHRGAHSRSSTTTARAPLAFCVCQQGFSLFPFILTYLHQAPELGCPAKPREWRVVQQAHSVTTYSAQTRSEALSLNCCFKRGNSAAFSSPPWA